MDNMTPAEVEQYYKDLDNAEPGQLTPAEAEGLAKAEALAAGGEGAKLPKMVDGYSGRLVIRIPKSLHRKLKDEAEAEGVSLNQLALYKLSR